MESKDNNKPQAEVTPISGKGGPAKGNPGRKGGGKGQGQAARRAAEQMAQRPMAEKAKMQPRHWAIMISFLLVVLLPVGVVGGYLGLVAKDQYASTVAFTVRSDEGASSAELLGGIAQLAGNSASPDGDVLYEFIRSQEIVRRIDEVLDLRTYFATRWSSDPVFALKPNASIEDLHKFWEGIVSVSYDQGSGLSEIQVLAFDAEMAQRIAEEIVDQSQTMVNALNETARDDAIRYADAELMLALDRLTEARKALTEFRTRTQIVDLEADIQGRMGVMNNLQQQLAQELVAFDELSTTAQSDDPRLTQALRRIQVIRERIIQERQEFANTEVSGTGEDYPTLIAEFEGLTVQREFAEETYRAALASRDAAQAAAIRQSRYLATYIRPTLAESSEFPQRGLIFGLATLFLLLTWGIGVLVFYSIRDRG